MSLQDIANGCKGSEGTITLGPDDAQELLLLVKKNGGQDLLRRASSSTTLLTGKNKDPKAAKASGQGEPEGTYIPTGNGGIEISCIALNTIVFGDNDGITSPKENPAADEEDLVVPKEDNDPLNPEATNQFGEKLADLGGPSVSDSPSDLLSEVADIPAAEAIEQISRMTSKEKLTHISKTDSRSTVRKAAEKRLADLG